MIARRTEKLAVHANLFHVLPAGMFQPEMAAFDVEWNVYHNILKEYAEELYGFELDEERNDPTYFYKEESAVRRLRKAIDNGKCLIMTTGLVISLLNLRPEICTILLVKDADWWIKQRGVQKLNWEYMKRQEMFEKVGGNWTDYELNRIEEQFLEDFGTNPGQWVPPGLGALWLGVDAARVALGLPATNKS